ncbi:hypothetical protein ACFQ7O_24195 [Streptomyces sp. NPDC056485]|uniref:hypothetical protein n=1 Tax=Streptomyces sp. NPDC056485 TaxID=3345834 RepID=UPI0036B499E1
MTAPEREDLPEMERQAFDLHRLTLEVEASEAHPDGMCTQAHMCCRSCGQLAPIAIWYGGPMARCNLCYFAWAVHHDAELCWLRSNFYDAPDSEEMLAALVLELAPRLQAARIILGEIADL